MLPFDLQTVEKHISKSPQHQNLQSIHHHRQLKPAVRRGISHSQQVQQQQPKVVNVAQRSTQCALQISAVLLLGTVVGL